MDEPLFALRSLSHRFTDQTENIQLLQSVDFSIQSAEQVAIVGRSGSGKSTLLHIMSLLLPPTDGQVLFQGKVISHLSTTEKSLWRRQHLGMMFQFNHLFPELSVVDNVALPLVMRGCSWRQARIDAKARLADLDLSDRQHFLPDFLSGGERQRVALARALVHQPSLLIADEPTGNLDQMHAKQVLNMLLKSQSRQQCALILVTHDMSLAAACSHQYRLDAGRLTEVKEHGTFN